MALCSEACVPSLGEESYGNEAGSSCTQFGVRSYLHHFYEECSSTVWESDTDAQGFVQSQRQTLWSNSAIWKVSLALGLLLLTAGITSLSAGYATPHKIESFGEGDLFFVDTRAVSFNRGLHISTAAGIWLTCFGSALAAMGVVVWILPKTDLKERIFPRQKPVGQTGESGSNWRKFKVPRDAVTKPPGKEEGELPVILSKVENVQPTSIK